MIKIVQIQHSTSSAGSAAIRLQKAFLRANIDSKIVSLIPDIFDDEGIVRVSKWSRLKALLDTTIHSYLTRKSVKQFGSFTYPVLGSDLSRMKEVRNADFIYIHWALLGFLNLESIAQLARLNKPVIIFMHDMWTITGGCHHSFTCEKYKTECHSCPVFSEKKKKDLSYFEFRKKLKLYSKFSNLFFVSPSKWLFECAQQSALTKGKPIFHIPNILDTKVFKPFDKKAARQILNLPADETLIVFGAVYINSPYKGWSYLHQALEILKADCIDKQPTVVIFGSSNNAEVKNAIPFKTIFLGYLKDEHSAALIYNAADVFVVPSVADNLPTTVLECLSCGTPVVGFDVGGIPDMIEHKQNGYLARYKDAQDLAEGIEYCIENKMKGYLPSAFEPEFVIQKHIQLFNEVKKNSSKHYDSNGS